MWPRRSIRLLLSCTARRSTERGGIGDLVCGRWWERAAELSVARNGVAIPAATRNHLLLQGVSLEDGGDYDVVVSNPAGQMVSQLASVVVSPVPGAGSDEIVFDLTSMGVVFNEARSNQSSFNPNRPGGIATDGEWVY